MFYIISYYSLPGVKHWMKTPVLLWQSNGSGRQHANGGMGGLPWNWSYKAQHIQWTHITLTLCGVLLHGGALTALLLCAF